jgi:hypothetical protein
METLEKDWVTAGLIDFEYKKYLLLGYLKKVKEKFDQYKLYPELADLVFHFRNLEEIKNQKQLLQSSFPKYVSKADFEQLKLVYQQMVKDDVLMEEINSIISYAIPLFKHNLDYGASIYEHLEKELEISEIGVSPLYKDAGYLFIEQVFKPEYEVYQYQVSLLQQQNEQYRGIHMRFIGQFRKSLSSHLESIKLDLIKSKTELPNPATFLVFSRRAIPHQETLLPMAKRLLVRYLSKT